jgi:hypothetical protein
MEALTGWIILTLLILIPIQGLIWLGLRRENDRAFRLAVYLRARQLSRRSRR